MKISELVALRPAIEKLATKEYDLPTAIEFAKFTRKILEAIQEFEQKRSDLFIKYGEKTEDGKFIIKPENETKFKAEIQKGLNKAVKITPLSVAKLDMNVAPADLINCLSIFK